MNVGEFFITLGVDADSVKLKDFVKTVAELPVDAVAAIGALSGVTFEMSKIAEGAINAAVGFQMFHSETGLSTQRLQVWQNVAQQANVSAESVTSSVEALQRQLAEIRLGRGNAMPFQIFGISAQQDAFGVLEQLRRKVRGMDPAMATNLIGQMGLSPEMMNVLNLSEARFKQYSATVRGLSEEQVQSFLRAKLSLTQFGMALRDVGTNFLSGMIDGLGLLVDKLKDVHIAVPAITAAVAALGLAFAPLTTAVVAFLLVLEDLAGYATGKKSLFGEAMEKIAGHKESPKQWLEDLKSLDPNKNDVGGVLADLLTGKYKGYDRPPGYVPPSQEAGTLNNVNIHVHSTAPAAEVGREVRRAFDKAVDEASYNIGNGGR